MIFFFLLAVLGTVVITISWLVFFCFFLFVVCIFFFFFCGRRVDAGDGFGATHEGELAQQAGDEGLQRVQALLCAGMR